MKKTHVTKTFLPPLDEYQEYLVKIWKSGQLTNQGPLVKEFEASIKKQLHIDNFHFVTNGTIALQLALQALDIFEGEIITTPFSYVATTSSILWQRCTPVFVDIDQETLCIDAEKIKAAITSRTRAIMPVHVFGNPCNIELIDQIAKEHSLKVIYDSAHAFGVTYRGKSLLDHGDISITSFHATKLFHTIEGGALIVKDKKVSEKIELTKRFGHNGDEHFMLGINAKASEFQAAMGLCNLKYINGLIKERKSITEQYDDLLGQGIVRPVIRQDTTRNYAYYPIILRDEKETLEVIRKLENNNIYARRYFYPSLNTLSYIQTPGRCLVSEDVSKRVLCLPLFPGLKPEKIKQICEIILV